MDQSRAPLYEAIRLYADRQPVRLHVPGHKAQAHWLTVSPDFSRLLELDVTELPDTDDLHHPTGPIAEAQALAAACFGAEESHFLVGGSTVGNLAMIMAVCDPEDLLIVPRNVHKSILHGLMLAGAQAVFMPPAWDAHTGLATAVTAVTVELALQRYPHASAVMITSPNYYGLCSDISAIADIAHRYGKPLLVDEAHGAHFGFHESLPRSAMQCGADAAVQSSHKMLSALTMGAMLHVQGELLPRSRMKQLLAVLQSSSPSYPILASLDLCRNHVAVHGRNHIAAGIQRIHNFLEQMQSLEHIEFLFPQRQTADYYDRDPFKVTLRTRQPVWEGYTLRRLLESAGCFPELADADHVLLALSMHTSDEDLHRLHDSLIRLNGEIVGGKKELLRPISNKDIVSLWPDLSEPISLSMPSKQEHADQGEHRPTIRSVSLRDSIGYRSAEMVVPYPPGIPILYAGERVSEAAVAYLARLAGLGASFQGASDRSLTTIRVFEGNGH